jgi:hypothetical protein
MLKADISAAKQNGFFFFSSFLKERKGKGKNSIITAATTAPRVHAGLADTSLFRLLLHRRM